MQNQLASTVPETNPPRGTPCPPERLTPKPVLEGQRTGAVTGWEVVTARIVGFSEACVILVEMPGNPPRLTHARTVVPITPKELGQQVVLAFENGDFDKPIILGIILTAEVLSRRTGITVDGEKIVLHAEREIELHCGAASITLTKAGKVLIKGAYLSSHASGVNRIKGGSVQIN